MAKFYDGIFKLSQSGGITTLTLSETLDLLAARRAAPRQKKPKTRSCGATARASSARRGSYSAATVRGTKWLVTDTCTSTITRVTQGAVTVRDTVRKRNVVVRKGGRYIARRA